MSEKRLYKNIEVIGYQDKSPVISKRYKGISTVNPYSNTFSLYDIALIKQDIINHFHIRQGEKLENPMFGTIIWDVLFEPLTSTVKDAIVQNVTDIINYDPRVQANNVIVDQYDHGLQIECEIIYLSYNISENMRLRFDQENGLIS